MQAVDDDDDENLENENESPLFEIRNYATFVKGALRRHRRLAAIVFAVNVVTALAVLSSWPKTYHVEAKVLAHNNAALMVKGDQPGNEAPTRTAAETILRRDALVDLVKQHDLIRYTADHRTTIERIRDGIARIFSTQQETDQDRMDAMVDLLEKRLSVWTNQDGNTVSIALDWTDPQMAVRIVDSAQQNYLESRHAQEITALSESIGILQGHATITQANVDDAVAALRQVRMAKDGTAPPATANQETSASIIARPARNPQVDAHEAQIRASIEAKQRAIADLEDFRRRRLTDLQAKLADQQAIYTENHPAVVDLKQAIAAASGESPQVAQLRSEIAMLTGEVAPKTDATASTTAPAGAPVHTTAATIATASDPLAPDKPKDKESGTAETAISSSSSSASEALPTLTDLREERDPNIMYARGRLRDAMEKNAALNAQIQSAQIDLETAEAAFKYRYAVVMPAHVPHKAIKPNKPLLAIAAILAGLLLAAFLAVVADLRTGRLVEVWQLERILARPIVADIQLRRMSETELK